MVFPPLSNGHGQLPTQINELQSYLEMTSIFTVVSQFTLCAVFSPTVCWLLDARAGDMRVAAV